ncbi:carcinoembryonic antigen-related cell adhesion molecule 6-like isoform X2 [Struthio camelus]|uniref:carcinoembryonic antigen-related cell adhesion molecule 6-like isoform X2 n=1 Tax=Struthio camelus TaxID=8801 RepID=UPI003603D6D1
MGCRRSAALALAAALLGCCCLRPAPGRLVVLRRPDPAAAGGNVTFALEPAPAAFRLCTWYRGAEPDPQREIFTYFAGDPAQTDGAAFTGRESSGPDCSMHLRALRTADSGAYTVHLRLPDLVTAGANLTVYAPLPRPRVTPAAVTAPENDTFALACDRPAGAETLLWLRDGAALAAGGRLTLAGDNRTLTVTAASRTDAGAYACEVGNPVSRNRSEPANVTVLYGPAAAAVSPPSPVRAPLGSRVELACAAAAVPPPRYRWDFGNATVGHQSRLAFVFEEASQAGEYRCVATNPALGRAAAATVLLQLPAGGLPSADGSPGTLEARTPGPLGPAAAPEEEEEIKYSTLAFRAPGAAARSPPRDGGTVYSEVKRR